MSTSPQPIKGASIKTDNFESFAEFYPFYLGEHADPICRALHYIGSLGVLCILAYSIITGRYMALLAMPIFGYGFAWVGHYVFEKNRPATFKWPLWSLMGDWVMLKDFLLGRFRK